MYSLVIGLIIFFCILLVLVVLAQNAKGGGLTSQFGGSGASNIIGVKKTGDLLEKLTWSFIIAIMVLSLTTNFISSNRTDGDNGILDMAGEPPPASNTIPSLNLDSAAQPADTTP